MARRSPANSLALLSIAGIAATAYGYNSPFPCEPPQSCNNEDSAICGDADTDVCQQNLGNITAICPVGCGTCPICVQPDPLPDFPFIIQAKPLDVDLVSVWILAPTKLSFFSASGWCKNAAVDGSSVEVGFNSISSPGFSDPLPSSVYSNNILISSLIYGFGSTGYYQLALLHTEEMTILGCNPLSFALSNIYARTLQPCPGHYEEFNPPSPPPDALMPGSPPSPVTASSPPIPGSDQSDLPFPCAPTEPCVDDATFRFYSEYSCSDAIGDPSVCQLNKEDADAYCPISCGGCQICAEPEPIEGVDAIVQIKQLTDTSVSVWLKSKKDFTTMLFKTACTSGGKETAVMGTGSFGGKAEEYGVIVEKGYGGSWSLSADADLTIPPGYYHLTTLMVESISALNCEPGSIRLSTGQMTPCLYAPLSPAPPPPQPPVKPIITGDDLFQCKPPEPCEDDATFLSFGSFQCGSTILNVCEVDPGNALSACPATCGECPICQEPDPIEGVDLILQVKAVKDNLASLWISSKQDLAGIQGEFKCSNEYGEVSVHPSSAYGGAFSEYGLGVNYGPETNGKWLSYSIQGTTIPAGYYHFFTCTISNMTELGCPLDSLALSYVVVANKDGSNIPFCGSLDSPCQYPGAPDVFEPPPSFSPPPPQSPPLMSPPYPPPNTPPPEAGIDLSGPLFPCDPLPPCVDDETFLAEGFIPCGSKFPDVCLISDASIAACPVSCSNCQPCAEPPHLPFSVTIQAVPISDTKVTVWFKSMVTVAGAQFQNVCKVGDKIVHVGVEGGSGGATSIHGMSVIPGAEGKWLTFSLTGGNIDPGYYQLTTIDILSLSETKCEEGTFSFVHTIIADDLGASLSFCGDAETPCPIDAPATPYSPSLQPSPPSSPYQCPNSLPGSGQVAAPFTEIADSDDIELINSYIHGTFAQPELFVTETGSLGCLGIIADGNGDKKIDSLDVDGFGELASGKDCPLYFSAAAGGPCAHPDESCSNYFHNGDVDNDKQLTVFDVDTIAAFIIQAKNLTECQQYRADGNVDGIINIDDLNGFSQMIINPGSCPPGFTTDLTTLSFGEGDGCKDAGYANVH